MPGAYDIHFQLMSTADAVGQQLFSFAYTSAKGVRGFQKTINQWMKCLLTAKGSDISDKNYGTDLPGLFDSNVISEADVTERIIIAMEDATSQILSAQRLQNTTDLTDDERLASAEILGVQALGPSDYTAYVLLRNILDQDVQIVLPTIS